MCSNTMTQENSKIVISIGNFDGVHLGHQELIQRARKLAGSQGKVIFCSFDPHPISKLRPENAPGRLSTFEIRAEIIKAAGADEVIRLEPTDDLLHCEPSEFIKWLMNEYKPNAVVEGINFRFGRNRNGDVEELRRLGQQYGFHTEIVPPVDVELCDQTLVTVSSTLIRWLLHHNRVMDAQRMLGRPYTIAGVVTAGNRRGRTIGIPTANIDTVQMLPANGVYACVAKIKGKDNTNKSYQAVANIGSRPTFRADADKDNCKTSVCEVHMLDYKGDIDNYGWDINLEFKAFLREELRFAGAELLVKQIHRDINRASQYLPAGAG